ncbi:hypothetical protein, partial [Acinetobacter baumannii]|uniref:hypothetical protein n=1 Tax=Acinetobacter baumannii TaxID=470 RepID=UPI003D6A4F6C
RLDLLAAAGEVGAAHEQFGLLALEILLAGAELGLGGLGLHAEFGQGAEPLLGLLLMRLDLVELALERLGAGRGLLGAADELGELAV